MTFKTNRSHAKNVYIVFANVNSEGLEQVKEFLRSSRDIFVFELNSFEQPWDETAHQVAIFSPILEITYIQNRNMRDAAILHRHKIA